jgi:hypothetical protein
MLTLVAIVLVVLWGIGMLASYTLGGYLHVLVLMAVVLLLMRIIREPGARPPLKPVGRHTRS